MSSAGTSTQLSEALKDVLRSRGILDEVKSRIRAEVFLTLDDQSEAKPPLCLENQIINHLIQEYLIYNNYKYTASVLKAESGHQINSDSQTAEARSDKLQRLHQLFDATSREVPLLYSLIGYFLEEKTLKDNVMLP